MPQRIATLGRERTIGTLARRIYGLPTQGDAALQRRAEAALMRANPRLRDRLGFESGASIIVPKVAGLQIAAELRGSEASGDGLVDETELNIQALQSRVEGAQRIAAAKRTELEAVLSDRRFVTAARRALPEAASKITETRARLTREAQEPDKQAEATKAAFSDALAAVARIRRLARRGSRQE